MVVGARQLDTHASLGRRFANQFYNRLASWMTGYRIEDLTSGFRAVRARHFRKFLYLLPNGFSYPTTSTMAFFRAGFPVAYVPIRAAQRTGKSHIKLLRDGARFFIIILKIGALFSPMRFFLPLSLVVFLHRTRLLRLHLRHHGPLHQHERGAVHLLPDAVRHWAGVGADLRAALQGRRGRPAPDEAGLAGLRLARRASALRPLVWQPTRLGRTVAGVCPVPKVPRGAQCAKLRR